MCACVSKISPAIKHNYVCSFVVPFTQGTESASQTLIKQRNTPVRKIGIILLLDVVTWKLRNLVIYPRLQGELLSKFPYG